MISLHNVHLGCRVEGRRMLSELGLWGLIGGVRVSRGYFVDFVGNADFTAANHKE
jgi:hypothetical protein